MKELDLLISKDIISEVRKKSYPIKYNGNYLLNVPTYNQLKKWLYEYYQLELNFHQDLLILNYKYNVYTYSFK